MTGRRQNIGETQDAGASVEDGQNISVDELSRKLDLRTISTIACSCSKVASQFVVQDQSDEVDSHLVPTATQVLAALPWRTHSWYQRTTDVACFPSASWVLEESVALVRGRGSGQTHERAASRVGLRPDKLSFSIAMLLVKRSTWVSRSVAARVGPRVSHSPPSYFQPMHILRA